MPDWKESLEKSLNDNIAVWKALARNDLGLLDWWMEGDVQVYPLTDMNTEWLYGERQCPECEHIFKFAAPEGTCGIECPQCHFVDINYVWRGDNED